MRVESLLLPNISFKYLSKVFEEQAKGRLILFKECLKLGEAILQNLTRFDIASIKTAESHETMTKSESRILFLWVKHLMKH